MYGCIPLCGHYPCLLKTIFVNVGLPSTYNRRHHWLHILNVKTFSHLSYLKRQIALTTCICRIDPSTNCLNIFQGKKYLFWRTFYWNTPHAYMVVIASLMARRDFQKCALPAPHWPDLRSVTDISSKFQQMDKSDAGSSTQQSSRAQNSPMRENKKSKVYSPLYPC